MSLSRDIGGIAQSWSGRALLLLDLDAFFASVEQLDHPQWRGRPVIVGGSAKSRGVVSTCSYEARAFGVRSAMPSATAQRLCPDAIWTTPNFPRYKELSSKVMDIMRQESPLLEQVSIDEAFLDVSPGRFIRESPLDIAERIQRRVDALGISCSIGVSTGKSCAKIASDMDKPRGLTVVPPGCEAQFLAPLGVRAMPGIGKRSAEALGALGIKTLGQLATCQPDDVKSVLGANSLAMIERAQGIDPRPIVTESPCKSVSHERTFSSDLTTREDIDNALDYLGSLVGRRLRKLGVAGHTVTVKMRFSDLSSHTAQSSLPGQVDDEALFIPVAKGLVSQVWQAGTPVRLVGIGISGFDEGDGQLSLFDEESAQAGHASARPRAVGAADAVRERFGEDKLCFGRQLKLGRSMAGGQRNEGPADDEPTEPSLN